MNTMKEDLFDINLEFSLLSSLLTSPNLIEYALSLKINKNTFYLPFNRLLFSTIIELDKNSVVDEMFIKSIMKKEFNEEIMLNVISATPFADINFICNKLNSLHEMREINLIGIKLSNLNDNEEAKSLLYKSANKISDDSNTSLEITDITEIKEEKPLFLCKSFMPIPENAVTIISGAGGVGKSSLVIQLALRISQDDNKSIFMWLSEDPKSMSKNRIENISKYILKVNSDDFRGKVFISGSESIPQQFIQETRNGVVTNSSFFEFINKVKKFDVIILDPLIGFYGADENNNSHARKFMNLFSYWATTENKTIIFIHHGSKKSAESRGASAFTDASRLAYMVNYLKDNDKINETTNKRAISIFKDNNGAIEELNNKSSFERVVIATKKIIIKEYINIQDELGLK